VLIFEVVFTSERAGIIARQWDKTSKFPGAEYAAIVDENNKDIRA
jgi:hypothetical protein